jgi:putative membrane protein
MPASNGSKGGRKGGLPQGRRDELNHILKLIGAGALIVAGSSVGANAPADSGPSDPEIAHIAYTAGAIDVAAAKQALARSRNKEVRAFADTMVRDHQAVNVQALALVKKLGVTPADNATSQALTKQAAAAHRRLSGLKGAAFDRAYVDNEVAYHATVNGALKSTLIPAADNAELKSLLETGLALFGEHQAHAEHLAAKIK